MNENITPEPPGTIVARKRVGIHTFEVIARPERPVVITVNGTPLRTVAGRPSGPSAEHVARVLDNATDTALAALLLAELAELQAAAGIPSGDEPCSHCDADHPVTVGA